MQSLAVRAVPPQPRQSTMTTTGYMDVSPDPSNGRPRNSNSASTRKTSASTVASETNFTFDEVFRKVNRHVEMTRLPDYERQEIVAGLNQLGSIHAATERDNAKLALKRTKLQAEVSELKQKLQKSISIAQTVSGKLSEERRMSGRGALMSMSSADTTLAETATDA